MWRDSEYNEMYSEFTLFVVEINTGLDWIGIGEEMREKEMCICFVLE